MVAQTRLEHHLGRIQTFLFKKSKDIKTKMKLEFSPLMLLIDLVRVDLLCSKLGLV